jgi:hypothetical protein
MKIFNIEPIKVTKYIFNEEHLDKMDTHFGYEFGFGYGVKKTESLNTLLITFNLLFYAGEGKDSILSYDTIDDNHYQFNFSVENSDDNLLLSYDSSCQFNFESEGLEADVLSITEFLGTYYAHTEKFFQLYGFKTLPEIEKKFQEGRDLESSAALAIESLRLNNMYEF